MAISNRDISSLVEAYLAYHPDEVDRLVRLTGAVGRGGALTSRALVPGHVTTGAFLLNAEGQLLQIAHKVLGRWLNPGGHCEPEDATLLGAALRELAEETGIVVGDLEVLAGSGGVGMPVDIDVHPIPANGAKGEPAHWHYDFRFAFRLVGSGVVELQVDEVDGFRWVAVAEAEPGVVGGKLAVAFASSGVQPRPRRSSLSV